MSDTNATILNEVNGHRTTLFQGNKGPKTGTWDQTKQMACELNEAGFDIAFIPEIEYGTCADSLIRVGKIFRLADFKYCFTKKSSTLASESEHGFKQAETVILKLENIDTGLFNEAIDYLVRNEIPCGNILMINKYGKTIELLKKELKTGIYKKAIKGFL